MQQVQVAVGVVYQKHAQSFVPGQALDTHIAEGIGLGYALHFTRWWVVTEQGRARSTIDVPTTLGNGNGLPVRKMVLPGTQRGLCDKETQRPEGRPQQAEGADKGHGFYLGTARTQLSGDRYGLRYGRGKFQRNEHLK